jgi:hypothetical protein
VTGVNAIIPGTVVAGNRSVWQFGQIQVYDGGPDGVVATANNSVFAVQGISWP